MWRIAHPSITIPVWWACRSAVGPVFWRLFRRKTLVTGGCAKCGYPRQRGDAERCSECGAEFASQPEIDLESSACFWSAPWNALLFGVICFWFTGCVQLNLEPDPFEEVALYRWGRSANELYAGEGFGRVTYDWEPNDVPANSSWHARSVLKVPSPAAWNAEGTRPELTLELDFNDRGFNADTPDLLLKYDLLNDVLHGEHMERASMHRSELSQEDRAVELRRWLEEHVPSRAVANRSELIDQVISFVVSVGRSREHWDEPRDVYASFDTQRARAVIPHGGFQVLRERDREDPPYESWVLGIRVLLSLLVGAVAFDVVVGAYLLEVQRDRYAYGYGDGVVGLWAEREFEW